MARLLALALLLAGAACAMPPEFLPPQMVAVPGIAPIIEPIPGTPPGKPGFGQPHAADIPGPACVAEHRQLITAALDLARVRMAEAIRFIEARPEDPHVQRWFGDTPPAEVAQRLRGTADWLERTGSLKILCNDLQGCRGMRMAYIAPSRQIMGLCPAFFRASATGYDSNWGVLVHEASHLGGGTQDHVYGAPAALALAQQDSRRAGENADSYEYFVETLPR